MYQFNRVVTLQNGAVAQRAVGFAMELTGYLNKTYGISCRCGLEMFGAPSVHWQFEHDSLDKMSEIHAKLFEDKTYWAMLEKGKEFWLAGSLKDTIVNYPK